jgi:hypothetical protein
MKIAKDVKEECVTQFIAFITLEGYRYERGANGSIGEVCPGEKEHCQR